jgi:hypothetical protein
MAAPFKNGGYYIASTAQANVTLTLGKHHSGTFTNIDHPEGLLEPAIAEKYDLTYDDGVADSGRVRAVAGSDFSASPELCQNAGVYNSTSDQNSCILRVSIAD